MVADSSLRIFPDPILRKPCQTIKQFGTSDLKALIRDLEAVLSRQKHGIGIAAPQIGISKAVALVDVRSRNPKAQRLILINPKILEVCNEIASREGCMSLPDYRGDIKRYNRVMIEWNDLEGNHHRQSFEGIEAICIQHEVDHLNGRLFLDHIASLKRDLIPRSR